MTRRLQDEVASTARSGRGNGRTAGATCLFSNSESDHAGGQTLMCTGDLTGI